MVLKRLSVCLLLSVTAFAESRVAVIDTGYSQERSKVTKSTQILIGRNFIGSELPKSANDTTDQAGHGSALADEISKICPEAKIIPIKVSRLGSAIDAKEVAQGIDWAISQGANVINLSFGISGSSRELTASLDRAHQKKVVVVAAAGMGVPNPYKPEPLSHFLPQAHPGVTVVGIAPSTAQNDTNQNFGPELDLVVLSSKNLSSSSFASAQIAGKLACNLRASRASIRASTASISRYSPDSFGFGIVDDVKKLDLLPTPIKTQVRKYLVPEKQLGFDLNTEKEISKISSQSRCVKKIFSLNRPEIFKKGRARFIVNSSLLNDCPLSITVTYRDKTQEDLDLNSLTNSLGDKPF